MSDDEYPAGEEDSPPTDEHFDGIPPEQLPSNQDALPALEPEFAEALRKAGGRRWRRPQAPVEGSEPRTEAEPELRHGPEPEPGPIAETPPEPERVPRAEPYLEPEPRPEPVAGPGSNGGGDTGETIEYAPGDHPAEGPDADEGPNADAEPDADEGPDADERPDPDARPAADAPPAPAPPAPVPPPRDPFAGETVIMRAGREEAREAFATAAETGRPWAPKPPPPSGDPERPPKRKRLWLHFLAAAFIVVASFASATTAVGVLRLTDIVAIIHNFKHPLPLPPYNGGPQTFLILGSDRRAATAGDDRGLSDTTILLRVDPDAQRIAVMNIPRDLKTYIPGFGTDKFNAAYALGGPKLTLRTLRRLTAHTGLQINHVVNVDFLGFAQAINAINCVYVDVDRRYYHSNIGVPASEQYSEINIQPGYQRLCGADGLAYVRYRHTDTDLVRAARQQDFLREARQRVPTSKLITDQDGLINIFASHTTSDIDTPGALADVLKLMVNARNAAIKEIHFPATLGYSYVFASRSDIAGAIHQFLGFQASGGPRGSLDAVKGGGNGKGGATTGQDRGKPKSTRPSKNQKKKKPKSQGKAPPTPTPQSDGLVDASSSGLEEAKKAARKASSTFPIYYPTRVPPGSVYDDNEQLSSNPRVYHVKDTSGDVHEAYKTVLEVFADDGSHYFGVQGIRGWDDPPALSDPSESRTIGDLECSIFLDGDRVRSISWTKDGNSYWVSNDLLQTLTNDQMLGLVRSMRSITPNVKYHPKPKKKNKK